MRGHMVMLVMSVLHGSLNYAELTMNYASEGRLTDFANARESSGRSLCEVRASMS